MGRKIQQQLPPERNAKSASQDCFVMMPFGGWFDRYFKEIYVPAITSVGLTPRRADDLYRPSAIVHDIWHYTKSSVLILADLTGKNPNVFYELGLAHAVAKPVILVTASIEDVPFDLRALRVIEYDRNDPQWGEILRAKIKQAIREVVASPLQAVLPSFLNLPSSTPTVEMSEDQRDLILIKQELQILRNELRRLHHRGGAIYPPSEAAERIRILRESGITHHDAIQMLARQSDNPGLIVPSQPVDATEGHSDGRADGDLLVS